MTGASNSTRAVAMSLNPIVDGLVYGVAWSGPITYAFPASVGDYAYYFEPGSNFAPTTTKQKAAALFALDQAAGFIATDILAGNAASATVRFAQSDEPTTAYAYMPGDYTQAGDMWFGRNYDYTNAQAGNYAWHTVLHELGHALGLKHGHESQNGRPALPIEWDSLEYSVMTYRSYAYSPVSSYSYNTWSAPQTWMVGDIAALQQLYGADYESAAGNTTYKWSPDSGNTWRNGDLMIDAGGKVIFASIWDGGGTDTFNLSAFTTDTRIDLAPGSASVFSGTQLARLGDGHLASGNIYNALLHDGDTRSLIENATGGRGNDRFEGNAADNRFKGNAGRDVFVFEPGEGHDTIVDFTDGDRINLKSFDLDFQTLMTSADQVLDSSIFSLDAETSITLLGVSIDDLTADDFRF